MDKDFLLKTYGQCYDSEAGPWNLSLKNKYLEYMFAKFFEENFVVDKETCICNVGIGAGYWDRYLSYQLKGGSLTSIEIDELSCRQLKECLINEKNPNQIYIIHQDIMQTNHFENQFDIVTMVGSTRRETGLYEPLLKKVFSLLKNGGSLFYQTLDEKERKEDIVSLCEKTDIKIDNYLLDTLYGFKAQYWKLTKYSK